MARKPRLLKLAPVETPPQPTLAAKVTGHNLANISYLVSKAAERGGFPFKFQADFGSAGELIQVAVPAAYGGTGWAPAGVWLFLIPGKDYLTWHDRHPVQSGLFRELG